MYLASNVPIIHPTIDSYKSTTYIDLRQKYDFRLCKHLFTRRVGQTGLVYRNRKCSNRKVTDFGLPALERKKIAESIALRNPPIQRKK